VFDIVGNKFRLVTRSTSSDQGHSLATLAATLGELIGDYDDEHFSAHAVSGVEVLQHLMESHGLKQSDLPEIGSQRVVSEVIRGRRELNVRQIRALAQRFGVSASHFVGIA
jgi:HTH-type transcriptional regulator / antitoxin HigA